MIISFFSSTDYATWIDCSDHPDCIGVFTPDFNPNTQTIKLDIETNQILITDNPIEQPPEA